MHTDTAFAVKDYTQRSQERDLTYKELRDRAMPIATVKPDLLIPSGGYAK